MGEREVREGRRERHCGGNHTFTNAHEQEEYIIGDRGGGAFSF